MRRAISILAGLSAMAASLAATAAPAFAATASDSPRVSLTPQTRILAALIAIAFTLFVLDLIRRHRLQERYSVIWFVAGLAMLAGAAFPGLLEVIAELMGVRDTNVALFSLILLLLLGLALNFSIIVSRQAEQITRLAQEQAISRAGDGGGREGGDHEGGGGGDGGGGGREATASDPGSQSGAAPQPDLGDEGRTEL